MARTPGRGSASRRRAWTTPGRSWRAWKHGEDLDEDGEVLAGGEERPQRVERAGGGRSATRWTIRSRVAASASGATIARAIASTPRSSPAARRAVAAQTRR